MNHFMNHGTNHAMTPATRRVFLADVGRGMLLASLGPVLTADLGIAHALTDDTSDRRHFGARERATRCTHARDSAGSTLADPRQTSQRRNRPEHTRRPLDALANARTFGGQDYTSHHSLMTHASIGMRRAGRLHTDLQSQGHTVAKDTVHMLINHLIDAFVIAAVPVATESVVQHNRRKLINHAAFNFHRARALQFTQIGQRCQFPCAKIPYRCGNRRAFDSLSHGA